MSRPPLASTLALLVACTSPPEEPGAPDAGTAVTTGGSESPDPSSASGPPTSSGAPTTGPAGTDPMATTAETTTDPMATGDILTGTSTGAVDPPRGCGDGHIDPGEACDNGHILNSNSAVCTLHCENAACGDGFLWEGQEECDHGPDNNDVIYGGCRADCFYGPRCGDGVVQPDQEQCDMGIHNGTGVYALNGVPCSITCRHAGYLAFLSSAVYPADALGGAAMADARCQELADAAGLDNADHFMAWISDGASSPATRFAPAIPDMPYALLSGVRVADNRDQLLKFGPIQHPITMTETGQSLPQKLVWTATAPDGTLAAKNADCKQWTSTSKLDKAWIGLSGPDPADPAALVMWKEASQWTVFVMMPCHHQYHIYCVEQ